jgi:hypothetical protein
VSGPEPVRISHHLVHSNVLSKEIGVQRKRHTRLPVFTVNGRVSQVGIR